MRHIAETIPSYTTAAAADQAGLNGSPRKAASAAFFRHRSSRVARERRAHAIEPQIVLNDRPCVAVAWGPPASVRGERILQVGASLVPSALSLTKNVGASAL